MWFTRAPSLPVWVAGYRLRPMSTRRVTLTFCDMPHDEEVEAVTVTIDADRRVTQVDLCSACRAQYLGPLVTAGRSTTRRAARRAATR